MNKENVVRIQGEILYNPVFDTQYQGKRYYKTEIELKRFSGRKDVIPLRIPERFLKIAQKGNSVKAEGEFNSITVFGEDGKQHLKLFVFANNLEICNEETNLNEIYLKGHLGKRSEKRETPFGRELTDFTIITKRWNGKTDCIPCIAWNGKAEYIERLQENREIEVFGRLQSRKYIKKFPDHEEQKVAYEISAIDIARVF